MGQVRIHHLATTGDVPAVPALDAAASLDIGEPLALMRGPNLYLSPQPGAPPGPRPVAATGIAHWCVQSLDSSDARARLEATGATFLSAQTALGTGFRYAYGHTSGGGLFELETAPFLPAEPPAWFGHVALVSPHAERLAGFYAALLDAPVTAGGRFRDNARIDAVAGLAGVDVEIWWVRADGFTLEFWRYHAPSAPAVDSASWYPHLGLEVGLLEPAMEQIVASGGNAGSVAAGRDGRSSRATDPDGNALLLIELARPDLDVAALPHRDAIARAAAARSTA